MGLFDIAVNRGGSPVMNTAMPSRALNTTGQMPWASGFNGLNAITDEERRKRLMMMMQQQQMMGQRNIPEMFLSQMKR